MREDAWESQEVLAERYQETARDVIHWLIIVAIVAMMCAIWYFKGYAEAIEDVCDNDPVAQDFVEVCGER